MGRGITTENFIDPLVEWNARLAYLGHFGLEKQVRDLLKGNVITARDGDVEIAYSDQPTAGHHILTVRIPDAPRVADIGLRVLTRDDALAAVDRDGRLPTPSTDRWRQAGATPDFVEWELFNCVVWNVSSRAN